MPVETVTSSIMDGRTRCPITRYSVCLAGLALVAISVSPAVAQLPATSPMPLNTPERLVASAVKVDEAPTIDGVLDENMWKSAPPLGEFVQAEPFTGMPGSERTEVRLLYDDDAIYVGVMLYDRDPSLIVTTDTRRDAGLSDMDSFQMIFDTFHDQQNGFVFGTNVAGDSVRRAGARSGRSGDELGWKLGREHQHGAGRVDRRVSHSAADAAVRTGAANVGRQFLSQHSAHARADVLVAARTRLRPRPVDVGRRAARAPARDAAQLQAAAVRGRIGRSEFRAWRLDRPRRRSGPRRQVRIDPEPEPGCDGTTPTLPRSRWTRSRSTSPASTCASPRSVRSSSRTPGSLRSARATSSICSSAAASVSTRTVCSFQSWRAAA